MARHNPIITGQVKVLVCDLHAQGQTTVSITKELASQGIKIQQRAVWGWLHNAKNTADIQKAVERYRTDPLAVAIAHKRVRLEDLNKERVSLIATLQRFKDPKGLILAKKFKTYLYGLKRLIEMEREAREEIERRPDMVAYFQRIGPYADHTNEELRKTEKEIVEQLLIVSRQAPASQGTSNGQESPKGTNKG